MSQEVACACLGAKAAGATMVYVKDAHDSARNIDVSMLPDFVKLHRGWEGGLCSMMAGLDRTFDAVMFVGYHSPSRSDGNPLSHTMNTHLYHVKINGIIASEFYINALYAAYLGIPVAFLSGDLNLKTRTLKPSLPKKERTEPSYPVIRRSPIRRSPIKSNSVFPKICPKAS
jgi:D-amino peptidase